MSSALDHATKAAIQANEFSGKRIVIAYSGGLDSSVLLHKFSVLNDNIRAIHIHHGLHADADLWLQHCEHECQKLNIPLSIFRVRVDKQQGAGLEAAARIARYQAIASAMQYDELLLTAHHQNDQAETLLQRLMRASGSQGLAGMRQYTESNGMPQYRPLLKVPRAELLAYAQHHRLTWIEDPSNTQTQFDRNFLRHDVLPLLQSRWPHAVSMLSRSADILREEHQCLNEQAALYLAQVQSLDPSVITISKLQALSPAWRAQVLRHWVNTLHCPALPSNVLQQIENELLFARHDSEATTRWERTCIRRWRDALYCSAEKENSAHDWQHLWQDLQAVKLPDQNFWGWAGQSTTLAVTAEATQQYFGGPLHLSFRRGGEKIQLPKRSHHSSIKQCLQALGIPPWQRQQLPLLSSADGECLAFGDVLISEKLLHFQQLHGLRFTQLSIDTLSFDHCPNNLQT
jgi:tRNA(Ile)-lysidine synthase